MPYPGVSSDKTDKMDSCVRRVTRSGKSKDTSIAICHDAIMGKKKEISAQEWNAMSDEKVEQTVDEVLTESDKARKEKEKNHEKGYVPFSISTFQALDDYRKAQEQADEVYSATSDFAGLIENVMYNPDITDKGKAIKSIADEFSSRIDKPKSKEQEQAEQPAPGFIQRVINSVAETFGLKPKEQEHETAMMIWKEDDGSYRWVARYSNNFRDDDNPPEIISEKSHKRYVEKVDSGEFELPELWLWHIPDWKVGKASSVAYDDSGFAVATGYFDKGKEDIAEWLSKQQNVAVSHAMPSSSIVRDTNDPSVIVEHQTVEISPLPLWAAANKLTGFIVLDALKEADMAIPQKKRDTFIKEWGIDPTLLDKLEQQNAQDAEKATSEGRESKEQSEQTAENTQGQEQEQSQTTQETTTTGDPLDQSPSRREIADAFGTILSEMKGLLETMAERVSTVEETVKELKTADEEKVSKAASEIPAASLGALLAQRVIGRQETAVDGRSSLAKSKPKEAEQVANKTGIPFIDSMIGNKDQ